MYYCGSIEVEDDLVRTGQREVEQRLKDKKFKEMVRNVKGSYASRRFYSSRDVSSLGRNWKGMEELALVMSILVLAGFGFGWIVKECIVLA